MRHAALFLTLIVSVLVCGRPAIASRDYPRPLKLEELTAEQQELIRKVMSLATVVAEERITYHFGKPAPCEKLLQSGTYTGEVFEKYSRLSERGGAVAGHGIYIAGNPYSSVEYFNGGGLQVVLAPGTKMIDLTDSLTQKRMRELGVTRSDIYNLPLDAVVRYQDRSDWFVVKGATGVRFEPIDFSRMSDASFSRFMEGARYTLRGDQVAPDLQASILARVNSPSPDRGRVAVSWFFLESSTNLERFGELAPETRRDALEYLRSTGKLTDFFKNFPSNLSSPNRAAAVRSAFEYLDTIGLDREACLSAYLLGTSYRSRERFLELPSQFRPVVLRRALEDDSVDALIDILRTHSFSEKSEAEVLNQAKAALKGDLAARFSSGAAPNRSDISALLLLAQVDGGKWVRDWELQAWVDALTPEQRGMLEIRLAAQLSRAERGTGFGLAPTKSEFLTLGRLLAALNPPGAEGRSPAATSVSKALAERYLAWLKEKYDVKKPALPRLSKTALGESCRTAMSRTLSGLMTLGVPMAVGVGVSSGFSYLEASRKAEVRQALQSLCEGEGGSYLRPSDTGPGGCRCRAGSDITWTWDSLGKRDPQSRICGP